MSPPRSAARGRRSPSTARYLVDVLSVLRTGQVMLGMNGSNQAGVVRPLESEDYTYVIMPMVIGAH